MDTKIDKFSKAIALVKEARAVVNDLLWNRDPRVGVKEVYLLGLLAQIQSLTVSIRADVIEALQSNRRRPDETPPAENRFMEKLAFTHEALLEQGRSNIIPFDRRRLRSERRRTHTYLARDQRSGIADRRRKKVGEQSAAGSRG